MMSCRDAHRLLIEKQDRKLGMAERLFVRMHLLLCAACRRFDGQIDLLRQALNRFPGD